MAKTVLPTPAATFGWIPAHMGNAFIKETFTINKEHRPEFGGTVNLYTEAQVLALLSEPLKPLDLPNVGSFQ